MENDDVESIPWDEAQLRKIKKHPCFSKEALHLFGRIHLPVAPRCNIQCNYCVRRFDCVNESRPGVTSRVLDPEEAVEREREVLEEHHYIKVAGIAGPGEPLFNEATFETFRLLKEEFPHLLRCVSTNGLLLPERIDDLHELGVSTITVTLNAIDPEVGEKIYSWVEYDEKRYEGREAAEILLQNQLRGIKEALSRKIIVKVNTVLIPGINDAHILEIARTIGEMGVFTGEPRSATVQAVKTSALLILKSSEMNALIRRDTEFGVRIMSKVIRILSERISADNFRIQEFQKYIISQEEK